MEHQEGLIALRTLLGYGRNPDWTPNLAGFSYGDRLPDSPMRDVLFVGIDIDTHHGYDEILPNHEAHIGVSILDTRSLQGLVGAVHATQNQPPEDLLAGDSQAENKPTEEQWDQHVIKSYQFVTDGSSYCARAVRLFRFGPSEKIDLSDFNSRFESLVAGRKVVLVMHGITSDLSFLRNLGFDLQSRYVIDTSNVLASGIRRKKNLSLKILLTALKIPLSSLHIAGNDAHLALRALLMIAVRDAQTQGSIDQNFRVDDDFLDVLVGIALAPEPLTVTGGMAGLLNRRRMKEKWEKERDFVEWEIAVRHALTEKAIRRLKVEAVRRAAKLKAIREKKEAKIDALKKETPKARAARKKATKRKAFEKMLAKKKAAKEEEARKKAARKAANKARKGAKSKAAKKETAKEQTSEEKAARECENISSN